MMMRIRRMAIQMMPAMTPAFTGSAPPSRVPPAETNKKTRALISVKFTKGKEKPLKQKGGRRSFRQVGGGVPG